MGRPDPFKQPKIGFTQNNPIGQSIFRVTCHFLQMRMRLLFLVTESPNRRELQGSPSVSIIGQLELP